MQAEVSISISSTESVYGNAYCKNLSKFKDTTNNLWLFFKAVMPIFDGISSNRNLEDWQESQGG